jgi:hypothetical protein
MTTTEMALRAMRAGLSGECLPNLGSRLTVEQLALVNAIYDEARNWSDGQKVKAHRVK